MPEYLFSNAKRSRIESVFCPAAKVPKKIRRDGEWLHRDVPLEHCGFKHSPGGYPYYSESMGCHRNQVQQYREAAVKAGVPTEITDDGRVKITDRNHRRRFMKAFKFYDRDAGYGDAARTYSGPERT